MKYLSASLNRLYGYFQKENYKGWDLFDGLNSQIFNHSPLYPYNDTCHFDQREKSLTICFVIRFLVVSLLEMTRIHSSVAPLRATWWWGT